MCATERFQPAKKASSVKMANVYVTIFLAIPRWTYSRQEVHHFSQATNPVAWCCPFLLSPMPFILDGRSSKCGLSLYSRGLQSQKASQSRQTSGSESFQPTSAPPLSGDPLAVWCVSVPLGPPFPFLPFLPSLSAALPHSLPLSLRLLHGLRYARLFSLGSPEGTLEILCGGTPRFVLIWCCWCGPPAAGLCVFLVVGRSFMFICLDGRTRTI